MNKSEAYKHVIETLNMPAETHKSFNQVIDLDKDIIIYGAGNLGKQIYNMLKQAKIPVKAFLDKCASQGERSFNIPVYKTEDVSITEEIKLNSYVIIAVLVEETEMQKIIQKLKQLGFENTINGYVLIASVIPYDQYNQERDAWINECKEILDVLELMEDDISRDVFSSNLRAHITFNYENTLINKDTIQYIKPNVPFEKGFSTFVDCGAYTGDTFEKLIKHQNVDKYIGFEPDSKAFMKLSESIDNSGFDNAYLYPCAIAERNYFASFSGSNGGASTLSENGDQVVQVVKMDDVLKNIAPTMIKMDIEGAEVQALHGCRNIILKNKPDLSICVYHKVSDLWRIPLLLHRWVPEYRFYIRCHHVSTIETVLYATV